ncbi:hypothetical protein niasHT_018821 [Heterodera trifolii]|uniref:Uncharacterized protein n=1 Tax=Heterodera trifolii TaxID=157864 RepID=A0ABD2L397_9BILA
MYESLSDTEEVELKVKKVEEAKAKRLEDSQKMLQNEVEKLKKELVEMKKKEVSRKRKRLTKNEQVKVEKVPTKVKEAKETEDGEKKDEKELKGIGNERELKEVNEEEKEKKDKKGKEEAKKEEIVLIDLEGDWKKVPQHEDEVSLGPEEEDEERILFPTPKGAELQNLSFWESCHNKAKSRGEMEEKSKEKEKRETNALRLARAEIRSAELSIIEKRDEEIPPEGKRIRNELDINCETEEEERNRKKYRAHTPVTGMAIKSFLGEERPKEMKEIIEMLLEIRQKALQMDDEVQKVMKKIEIFEKRVKTGAGPNSGEIEKGARAFWEHDERTPTFNRGRGRTDWRSRGNRGRGWHGPRFASSSGMAANSGRDWGATREEQWDQPGTSSQTKNFGGPFFRMSDWD